MMNWTKEQQKAIELREKNILVSAAAGSGKTAVLVERIKKLIIEDGVPIDRMLIVTFTNAAASEMKEKIRAALNKEIDKDPQNSKKLREQLTLLTKANISTFHAFALDVIRRFFYLTDTEPGFSICDDARRTIWKEDALDALLEQHFAQGDEAFYQFLNWYSSDRNQNKVREIIDSSYNVLQSLPYPWEWLDEKIAELAAPPDEASDSLLMARIRKYIYESLLSAHKAFSSAADTLACSGLAGMAAKVNDTEAAPVAHIIENFENMNFDELSRWINALPSLRLTAPKDEKEIYGGVKDTVKHFRDKGSAELKGLKNSVLAQSFDDSVRELNETAVKAETLRNLLTDFDKLFKEAKAEKNALDFSDIEHCALEILDNEEAADYYRRKFRYIFVDEYQDTNILQEEIISRVKGKNNLFMVGDVKQSIYKFRLAEPEIFERRYDEYAGSGGDSDKIDLNKNFRSKEKLLYGVNKIFAGLMENYGDNERLYPGVEYSGDLQYPVQLKVVDTATVDDADEELVNLKNTELEALEVCRIIKENLGRGYFDHKSGAEKKIQLRDIVILMRGVKNYADVFYNTLKTQGIDSYVDDNDGYFDTMEINVFMNLLSVVDNSMQDVPLISVLHSEIFGFSAEELAQVRAVHKDGSYWDAFKSYGCGDTVTDAGLSAKCAQATDSLKKWRAMAASMPLGQFIWKLLIDTGYYLDMGAMPAGSQRQANLRALVDKAESFAAGRQSSLYSFVKYIDAVKARKVPMGQMKLVGEADNLVRIMTVHKSKGLEFPMVILCGMGRRLNYTKIGKGVVLHKDMGIGMTLCDFDAHWYKQTLLQTLIQKQIRKEETAEEIRILYVAMTRAKDILYLTGTVKDSEKYEESKSGGVTGDSSYLDMIGDSCNTEIIDCNVLSSAAEETHGTGSGYAFDRHPSAEERAQVWARLGYIYPYAESRRLKSKYSVSQLNSEAATKEYGRVLAVPKFRQGQRALTAAEIGTVYHSIMERIDFDKAAALGVPYIKEEAERMVSDEILTREEVEAADMRKLALFFDTPLGRRCAEAAAEGRVERERAFDIQTDFDGEKIIVQGIIDCFFYEDDGIVLLDYKTNRISAARDFESEADRLRSMYGRQMKIYSKALEEATGKSVKESYLYLFDAGKTVEMKG